MQADPHMALGPFTGTRPTPGGRGTPLVGAALQDDPWIQEAQRLMESRPPKVLPEPKKKGRRTKKGARAAGDEATGAATDGEVSLES